jgi:hypothetical protein
MNSTSESHWMRGALLEMSSLTITVPRSTHSRSVTIVTTMNVGQARIRVTTLYGISATVEWMREISVPAGVAVDVIDFGYRVTITVAQAESEVTLIADLGTGDAAQTSTLPDDAPLVRFARLLLARRMSLEYPDPGPLKEPTTEIRDLVEATGAKWIRTDLLMDDDDDDPSQSRRMAADE